MKPEYIAAIEKQLAWDRWLRNPQIERELLNRVETSFSLLYPELSAEQDLYAQLWFRPVRFGDCYYVAPHVIDLVEIAAATLPGNTAFSPRLLMSRIGFVVLGRPFHLRFSSDDVRAISAIGWSSDEKAAGFGWFSDGALRGDTEGFHTESSTTLAQSQTLAEYEAATARNGSQKEHAFNRENLRFLLALVLFMEQRLLGRRAVRLDRASRRRAMRQGREIDHIQVVYLRAVGEMGATKDGEALEVDWTCRWVVRGHWRQQFYPSTNEHRPIWILPFVKGPDDAPMKDDQRRVFAVVR